MSAQAMGKGIFLDQKLGPDARFKNIVEQLSYEFGRIVQRGHEQEIVAALAQLLGTQTLAYALLKMRGLDLEGLRAEAERLMNAAFRNTTESS